MPEFSYEFHISRHAREKYQFDQSIFQTNGNVVIGNFQAARMLSAKINQKRDLIVFPEKTARASEIYALGLMDEIFHQVLKQYREKTNQTNLFSNAYTYLTSYLSQEAVDHMIEIFLAYFPPSAVYQKEISLTDYIAQLKENDQYPNVIEEIILLWVENQNPALENYIELFPEAALSRESIYPEFMHLLYQFFTKQGSFGPDQLNVIDFLLAPSRAAPNSITAQLDYIRTHWGLFLGELIYRLLSGVDFLQEETKATFTGPGPAQIPTYNQTWDIDHEKFSPDREWMPSLVLLAKNAFVWLDQLSKSHNRLINRLDMIPDEELDILSQRGFTGLWLIGLWERSEASATIKRLCGNPEAIASAYSLSSYQIASQLGGEEAYHNLKSRAWQRGIRLASDMVPNHMGIDSQWVIDHPNWFINLDYSPFPAYSFTGPNLSGKDEIQIRIEDHYFDRSDAAVVFQYQDHRRGINKYIYHGNDGTTMPWNDTAQLNYLLPDVREAVYQTILSVARKFPIIRFDAAMTLAKKHYQRLWFPEPGSGGAIPSRAEFGLTKDQFDQIMPEEFWREVVDRLSVDAPDTLLLAEAFWLMESYFVRTLGMHRVYNSAFMNMLRNEDNANYRRLIKNTLQFDPQILKRFVNFMNNPDEKTAAEQFGKGDKYFGICTLMSTLPGLPMFGHGQFEGFTEKYGMEFKRAYWDETPDRDLLQRHEQQIVPLLQRRMIFSEVDNFSFYDFISDDQTINEDVFAFSNYSHGQASLVVYLNKFTETSGLVQPGHDRDESSPLVAENPTSFTLLDALRIDKNCDFVIYRDLNSGQEFIQSKSDMERRGIHFRLHAYQACVLTDFRALYDDEWGSYRRLKEFLGSGGVPDINEALQELLLRVVQQPLREIFNKGYFDYLLENRLEGKETRVDANLLSEVYRKLENLAEGIFKLSGVVYAKETVLNQITQEVRMVLSLLVVNAIFPNPSSTKYGMAIQFLKTHLEEFPNTWISLLSLVFIHKLGMLSPGSNAPVQIQSWYGEWRFAKAVQGLGQQMGLSEADQNDLSQFVHVMSGLPNWISDLEELGDEMWLRMILSKEEVQHYLRINRFQNSVWFNQEKMENLLFGLYALELIQTGANPKISATQFLEKVLKLEQIRQKFESAIQKSGFKVENLLTSLN